MIAKVISGGQTGVDIAALRAAKRFGVPTGGTMPKGFKTLSGPRPDYAVAYGMKEAWSSVYAFRTATNVRDADVTIRIACAFHTAGELCTLRAIQEYGKPWGDVAMSGALPHRLFADDRDMRAMATLIDREAARAGRSVVVNFAGNSEAAAPGIERAAEEIVYEILRRCQR